jgi:subtilisin-like proprotein convertase family protein
MTRQFRRIGTRRASRTRAWLHVEQLEPRLALASVSGVAYNDLDHDGARDTGEPGLADRIIFVDANNNGRFDQATSTATVSATGLPIPLPDVTTTTSTLNVSGFQSLISDVNVRLHLTHTYDEDLRITLISPTGIRVILSDRRGGSGDNFGTATSPTTFDDEGFGDISAANPPFLGSFRPDQPLSALDRLSANGQWTLEVDDLAGADVGTLRSWSLVFSFGEPSALTGQSGEYTIDGLAAGTHTVRQVVPLNWAQSAPSTAGYTVTVVANEALANLDFGSYNLLSSLNGQLYRDANNNGTRDTGEPGLAGWTVYLDNNRNDDHDSGEPLLITDNQGAYHFTELAPGSYSLRIAAEPNWLITQPLGEEYNVSLAVADNRFALDFGAFPLPGEIRGVMWNDLNGDKARQTGEQPLAGWQVYLDLDRNDALSLGDTVVLTNSSGEYVFANLPPGQYVVGEVVKPGWKQTFPGDGPVVPLRPAAGVPTPPAQEATSTNSPPFQGGAGGGSSLGSTEAVSDAGVLAAALARATDLASYDPVELALARRWVLAAPSLGIIQDLVAALGASLVGPLPLLPNAYQIALPLKVSTEQAVGVLSSADGLDYFYPLVERQQSKRLIPNDPLFPGQWHLRNTGQTGGTAGVDANIQTAWDSTLGAGVVIGIVDDGLERTHPDLSPNFTALHSFDFNFNDFDPSPDATDFHGTAVAGVAAARGNNGIGVSGAAPMAQLAGLRLIAAGTTDSIEAAGLAYHQQDIDIYSNSWGPFDDGFSLEGPGPLTLAAIAAAARNGRGGLGNIYTWAAGNGLETNDNANYDGYASNRYAIAVGAIDHAGRQAYYSEPGASMLVTAHSNGDTVGITTTDRLGSPGYNGIPGQQDYTNDFGGTSSSTPLVSGVIALMLAENPSLTWRDVQHILVQTAEQNDPLDAGWTVNGAGYHVNHKYGFGAIDAAAAVSLSNNWDTVAAEVSASSGLINVSAAIPNQSTTGRTSTAVITDAINIETVEIVFTANHTARGNLRVVLTSPSGTESVLATPHADDNDNYFNWTFSSKRHWGEESRGNWTLKVTDETGADAGTWLNWRLNVYGAASNATTHLVTLAPGEIAQNKNFGNQNVTAPAVMSVEVAGTSWAPAYLAHLRSQGLGTNGYAIPDGASQVAGLPWLNLDRIGIAFSEPVTVASGDLSLVDSGFTDEPDPAVVAFNYDAERWVATWDFDRPLSLNKYVVSLAGAVADVAANALDGEWTNGVSRFASGDGAAGGQFAFRFNVVPGDVDGSGKVTLDEAGLVRSKVGRLVSSLGYFYRLDVDGSGGITFAESGRTRLLLGSDVGIFPEPVPPPSDGVGARDDGLPVPVDTTPNTSDARLPLRRTSLDELSLRLRLAIDELMHQRGMR